MNQDIGGLRRPGGLLTKTGSKATADSSQVTTCMMYVSD